jgi:DNA-binding transcriptional ArsR family regulator
VVLDVEVITDPAAAASALDPVRSRILAELAHPASAAALATRLGMARQKVNYHLRLLEQHHLVTAVDERQWGGIRERLVVATASSYVVSPDALGPVGAGPGAAQDRLSASYLIAVAARTVREVGSLWHMARGQRKRLATITIDTEIAFASPADRAAFAEEMAATVAGLAAKYHRSGGRAYRVVAGAYPAPTTQE